MSFISGGKARFILPPGLTLTDIGVEYRSHVGEEVTLISQTSGAWYVRFLAPFDGDAARAVYIPYKFLAPAHEYDDL